MGEFLRMHTNVVALRKPFSCIIENKGHDFVESNAGVNTSVHITRQSTLLLVMGALESLAPPLTTAKCDDTQVK